MGRLLVALAREDPRLRVAGAIEAAGHPAVGRDAGEAGGGAAVGVRVGDDLGAVCRAEQVVLDFTAPAATLVHARLAAERGAGLVIGTTGLDAGQQRELAALAARTRTVLAPNMSVGVTVLTALVSLAARLLDASFEAEIVELHHHAKTDAPSGTALALARAVAAARGQDFERAKRLAREGLVGERPRRFGRGSGRRLELVRFRWPGLTRDLAAGRFDLAMGGVTARPGRAVAGIFTRPVAEAGAVVLAHQRLDPSTSWLRLGVNAGGQLHRVAARPLPPGLAVATY